MSIKKYLIAISFLSGIVFINSCKKDPKQVLSDKTGRLTFINASYELNAYVAGNGSAIPLFWDKVDLSLNFGTHYGFSSPPQFDATTWNVQFPNYDAQDYSQPGQAYWANQPGAHTVIVADTAKRRLFYVDLTTSATIPQSLFITDSLGYFRSVLLNDDKPVAGGTANLRILNFCPDASNVFITVNDKKVKNLSEPVAFTRYHNFTPVPVARQDTLAIRLYTTADTVNAVTQFYATVYPGHAYTVLFSGYTTGQFYKNTAGTDRFVNPAPLLNVINTK